MKLRFALVVVVAAGCVTAPAASTPAPVATAPTAPAKAPPPVVIEPPPPPPAVEEPPVAPPVEPGPPTPAPRATPAPSFKGEEGLASYYADMLTGNKTASGERYQPDKATCAHRTLPFGTVLVVTAVATGRSATCRVNDRGPNTGNRIVDVSKSVAKKLGMLGPGVLRVRVHVKAP